MLTGDCRGHGGAGVGELVGGGGAGSRTAAAAETITINPSYLYFNFYLDTLKAGYGYFNVFFFLHNLPLCSLANND